VQLNATAFGSLTSAEQTDFGSAAIYAYLLGNKTGEERNGGTFRNRGITTATNTSTTALAASTYGSVLGDVVNSDPQIIANKDYGYTASDSSYATFLTGLTSEIIAVGANDGFFHLFDATPSTSGGGELLAFMPQAARTNIKDLASSAYSHRPFVDGSIGLGHAKVAIPSDTTVKWRSILVAAGGGGAQTVFAIDATTTAMTAGSVMWEVNQNTSGVGSTLGNVMGRPAIGKLPNSGTWVAIFGNGFNSSAGTANLYVVRLSDGVILQVIPTNSSYTGNGLGAIEIVRKTSGSADTIEYVYGADFRGRIWRFDLSSLNSGMSNWPTSAALIYTTPTGRPITAELKVGSAPTGTYTTGGKMVYFGTGSYLAATDPAVTTVQALYGIYDDLVHTPNNSSAVSEASLSAMTISMAAGADTRTTSNAASPAWYTYSTKKGWKVELTGTNVAAGERVIAPPVRYTVSGLVDAFLFTSIVPSVSDCDAGLDAWITGVDAMTGGYSKVFNGLTPNSVKIAGGSPRGVFVLQDGTQPTLYISQTVFNGTISSTSFSTGTGGTQDVTINGVAGQTRIISIDLTPPPPPAPSIPTTVKQVWRQLK
jgi:type IV pilus assembly protein PilY1